MKSRRADLPPETLAWVAAVEVAALRKGIVLDGEGMCVGLGCGLMFRARGIAKGHPDCLREYLEPVAQLLGLTLEEIEAVGPVGVA